MSNNPSRKLARREELRERAHEPRTGKVRGGAFWLRRSAMGEGRKARERQELADMLSKIVSSK